MSRASLLFHLRMRIAGLALVLTLAIAAALPPAALASCALDPGSDGNWYINGEYYYVSGTNGDLRGVRGDLWNYNPDPVYDVSAFWVALINAGTPQRWAQVGWSKWYVHGDSTNYIFLQFTDDNGNLTTKGYNTSTGIWGTYPQSSATSTVTYNVKYYPDTDKFEMTWDSGNYFLTSAFTWFPSEIRVAAEVHDWNTGNKGDQSPGDNNNHIHADSIQYNFNGSWYSAGGLSRISGYNADMGLSSVTYGFRIWDERCS